MNIFDILGPVMVGPSSSHTAGAARIGYITRKLLGSRPKKARIGLSGSFAATGRGHGTDRALVAGLLGMKPDDMRIPDSFSVAKQEGLEFEIYNTQIKEAHPNTALLDVEGVDGKTIVVQASSPVSYTHLPEYGAGWWKEPGRNPGSTEKSSRSTGRTTFLKK